MHHFLLIPGQQENLTLLSSASANQPKCREREPCFHRPTPSCSTPNHKCQLGNTLRSPAMRGHELTCSLAQDLAPNPDLD
jgi:hypothetical protein